MKLYTAKTYFSCVRNAAKKIAERGSSLSDQTIVFCEDKLTLSVEQALVDAFGGGTFNVNVTSFGRYASDKKENATTLSKDAAAIVMRKILADNADKLQTLSKLASSPSFAYETSELVAQLKSAKVDPSELALKSGECAENIRAKISDVAILYSAYEDFLKKNNLKDQGAALDEVPSLIARDEKLQNSRAVVVGFSSVTKQTAAIMEALIDKCLSVDFFAVKGYNKYLYANEFASFVSEKFNLPPTPTDDLLSAEQDALLNGLFDHKKFSEVGLYSDKVSIFEAYNANEEIEYVAKNICRLIHSGKYRFSDIAVAVGSLPDYRLRIKKTFGDYEIPFFLDEKKTLVSHPIAPLTESVLRFAASGDGDKIEKIISSSLFLPDKTKSDALIGALKKNSVSPKFFLDENFEFLEDQTLETKRATLAKALKRFNRKDSAASFVKNVKLFYDDVELFENAKSVAQKLDDVGAFEERAFLLSALDKAVETLDNIADLLGDERLTALEFLKFLSAGYKAREIGLIPQFSDGATVADIKDCRFKEYKILFAVGLSGEVPLAKRDVALLLDSDIAALEKLSVKIEPKISVANKREKEAAGIAFASFSDKLFLSFSLISPSGAQSAKSEIIDFAEGIFADKNGFPLSPFNYLSVAVAAADAKGERKDSLQTLGYERLRPALLSFIKDCDDFKNGASREVVVPSSFYRFAEESGDEALAELVKRLLGKTNSDPVVQTRIPPENYFPNKMTSASKIQTYYECPYKCFVKYGLGVADAIDGDVKALDFGNALHAIAERFVARIDEASNKKQAELVAEQVVAEALAKPDIQRFSRRSDFAYSLELTAQEGRRLCLNLFDELKSSKFKPIGQEVWFADWAEYPSLPLKTKNGTFKLYGKADRLDKYKEYARIIDYKSGGADKKVSDENFYVGKNLQLYLYLNAFVREGEKPAGAYYYAVDDKFRLEDDDKPLMFGSTLSSDEIVDATDPEFAKTGTSRFIKIKRSATTGKPTGSLKDPVAMQGYMIYAKKLAEKATEELSSGTIVASPYDGACEFCEYGGICGYDKDVGYKTRKVKSVKPETIVEAAYSDDKKTNDAPSPSNRNEQNAENSTFGRDEKNDTNEISKRGEPTDDKARSLGGKDENQGEKA